MDDVVIYNTIFFLDDYETVDNFMQINKKFYNYCFTDKLFKYKFSILQNKLFEILEKDRDIIHDKNFIYTSYPNKIELYFVHNLYQNSLYNYIIENYKLPSDQIIYFIINKILSAGFSYVNGIVKLKFNKNKISVTINDKFPIPKIKIPETFFLNN